MKTVKKISFVEYDDGTESRYLGIDMSCNRVVINADENATEESLGLIKEEDFDFTATVFEIVSNYINKDGDIHFIVCGEKSWIEIYHVDEELNGLIGSIDCVTERNILSVYIISNEIENSLVKII